MKLDPTIFSLSFILPFIIIIFIFIILFSPINPKPGFNRNPETHDPTIPSPSDSQLHHHHHHQPSEDDPTPILVSDTPPQFPDEDDPNPTMESGQAELKKKNTRKTKKNKMMTMTTNSEDEIDDDKSVEMNREILGLDTRPESVRLDPFTSSSSAMQKKMKPQYDESKKLSLSQVVQFANSLVDARSELQHKADATQRKFVITNALLCKADRSSFDRLRQQIYKLELEQKQLEEDAFVYNWLQQQLKLSPAYNKMLELGVSMEKEKSCKMGELRDDEVCDISFEELLAQEKKDTFWQRNGKSRLCSS
ncbi:uncharacterized protein LOC123883162 [Trifolium pratense]|uniref:uncharacterized protein LOC123883162 n=1 Tax=Trifolium pratense TaxID=57577 RepID=UPI001E69603D|nr:uncharacterized protein LOC123883162 [Trifolium pratense]